MSMKISKIMIMSVAFAVVVATAPAFAKDYPSGNINFTVPFPPGGGTDIPSRLLLEKVSQATGWNFVVENRPGAGGNIGLAQLSRAPSNGMSLGIGQTSNLAVNPSLYSDIPYDPLTDFTHIAVITTQPMAIVTHPGSPLEDFGDLLRAAEEAPGNVLFGTPGSGTVAHLSIELLASEAGLELTHVPYPGISQAISDVMSGVVDIYIGSVPSVLPHIRSGSIRPLAVTSAERNPALDDVPTVAEYGFDDFDAADWKAIVGPAGIPDEIVEKLNSVINEALQTDELRSAMEQEGSTVVHESSEWFYNYLDEELARWAEVVEISGATVD